MEKIVLTVIRPLCIIKNPQHCFQLGALKPLETILFVLKIPSLA